MHLGAIVGIGCSYQLEIMFQNRGKTQSIVPWKPQPSGKKEVQYRLAVTNPTTLSTRTILPPCETKTTQKHKLHNDATRTKLSHHRGRAEPHLSPQKIPPHPVLQCGQVHTQDRSTQQRS
mmetsp:Transcript_25025/g.42626  ORF Transcript_25025/g.42626 Transcript_25025/m.42626 type:complete len:120 (+) Transcript_25025:762-1121(+)